MCLDITFFLTNFCFFFLFLFFSFSSSLYYVMIDSTTVTTQVPQVQQPRYAAPSAPMYVPINNNVAPAPQPMNVPQNVDGGASWSDK